MTETNVRRIDRFEGPWEFLSNFYPVTLIGVNGLVFSTLEHAFQAAKTLDPFEQNTVQRAWYPGEAKKLGRQVTKRPDWEEIRVQVMRELLQQKFSKQPFQGLLLSTGDAYLEEGNWWGDTFWGVCKGVGENMLGMLLMETRENIIVQLRQMLVK